MDFIWPISKTEITKLSQMEVPLLIEGETGTGKSELVNELCQLAGKEVLRINVATLNDNLVESELFGHMRGSFTGALQSRKGLLDVAQDKWVFLDEIAEISPQVQKKLLDVLQNGSYTPVGANVPRQVKCRLLFATNANLENLVEKGEFRKDLYFRIRQAYVELPSLRKSPILLLNIYEQFKNEFKLTMDQESEHAILSYSWPGNIRELKAVMEMLSQLHQPLIEINDLPNYLKNHQLKIQPRDLKFPNDYKSFKKFCEKMFLDKSLKRFGGKINQTSKAIGMSKGTLIQKVREYQIDVSMIKTEYEDRIQEMQKEFEISSLVS